MSAREPTDPTENNTTLAARVIEIIFIYSIMVPQIQMRFKFDYLTPPRRLKYAVSGIFVATLPRGTACTHLASWRLNAKRFGDHHEEMAE